MNPEYHFLTHWRLRGTINEVADVLDDPLQLPRWWPSVYLEVIEVAAGDPVTHVGRVIDLYTKGWLPYTLRWRFTVTESRPPHGFTLAAEGDFVGTGVWTFEQDAEFANVDYDWRIAATKPLLRIGTPVFRPILGANHRWAMARGQRAWTSSCGGGAPTPKRSAALCPPLRDQPSPNDRPRLRCCNDVAHPGMLRR